MALFFLNGFFRISLLCLLLMPGIKKIHFIDNLNLRCATGNLQIRSAQSICLTRI